MACGPKSIFWAQPTVGILPFSGCRNILCSRQQNGWLLRKMRDSQKLDYKWYWARILLWSSLFMFVCPFFFCFTLPHTCSWWLKSVLSALWESALLGKLALNVKENSERQNKSFFLWQILDCVYHAHTPTNPQHSRIKTIFNHAGEIFELKCTNELCSVIRDSCQWHFTEKS